MPSPPPTMPPAELTQREAEVLALVREHLTNGEIGERLYISVRTVETHVSALLRKLGASDRRELARAPITEGGDRKRGPGADGGRPMKVGGSLPHSLTSFIGRSAELTSLAEAIGDHRLVTATGPGGVGKTRLAIEAARRVETTFDDGVVFVDLVKVGEPGLVGSAIADAADISDAVVTSRDDALIESLRDRRCLVVLDNCEHVLDAARVWVERLLTECAALHVLATSRVRLMLPFEHVVAVSGLSRLTDGDDAVDLFVERMVAAGSPAPRDAERATIEAICASLDGMALAIELAAARAPAVGLESLAEALTERIDLLDIGTRAHERHRSLRAAIDWSYELLPDDARAVLIAMATFASPADLSAIEQVVGLPTAVVVDAVAGLVDWNLVSRRSETPPRYRLLETIRQYATDVGSTSGDDERYRAEHRVWVDRELRDALTNAPGDDTWCASVDAVLDDARAAVAGAVAAGLGPVVAELADLLAAVLFQRGHPGEAQQRYEQAAAYSDDAGQRRARLHLAAGAAATRNVGGDTVDLLMESAAIAEAAGDRPGAARDVAGAAALQFRAGGIIRRVVDVDEVGEQLARARDLAGDDPHAAAAIAVASGWRPRAQAVARAMTAEALELALASGDLLLVDEALDQMMAVEFTDGAVAAALQVADRRLDILADVPVDALSGFSRYDALHMACQAKIAAGQLPAARRHADAIALLPYFREQRHLGMGRRLEVDLMAGEFEAVLANADEFERDWRRAGRPVAGNLAVSAYAASSAHSILGDPDRAAHWREITLALVPTSERVLGPDVLWRTTFDAFVALDRGDPEGAVGCFDSSLTDHRQSNPLQRVWLPWYAALLAEAAVLSDAPDADERVRWSRTVTHDNQVAVSIVDRTEALRDGRFEELDACQAVFSTTGCPYQARRTASLDPRRS